MEVAAACEQPSQQAALILEPAGDQVHHRTLPLQHPGHQHQPRADQRLAQPGAEPLETEGVCEGNILTRPFGDNGFGYDPVFYLPELGCTMAQLPLDQKNGVSHRGIAARKMRSLLQRLADEP